MIINNYNDFIKQTLARFNFTPKLLTSRRQGIRADDVLTILVRGLRDEFCLGWVEIGKLLGGRKHTTAIQLYKRKIRTKPILKNVDLDKILERVTNKKI